MDSASSAEKPFFSSNDEMFTYFATMYELDLTKIKCPQIRDISDGEIFSVILNEYNSHKSWKKNRPYYASYDLFNKWIEKNGSDTEKKSFSPCTGDARSKCGKWVKFDKASKFVVHASLPVTGGGSAVSTATVFHIISALNYVMKRQHRIAEHVLGNSCPPLKSLTQTTGMSGHAVKICKKRTKIAAKAKSLASSGIGSPTMQEDPLRGHVDKPFTESELVDINKHWLVGYVHKDLSVVAREKFQKWLKRQSPCNRQNSRLIFNLALSAVTRGDCVCNKETTSIGHLFLQSIPECSPDKCYSVSILKNTSKSNDEGWTEYAGFVRHKLHPITCCMNSVATVILARYGRNGEQKFPDIFNGDCNWTANEPFITSGDGLEFDYRKRYQSFLHMIESMGFKGLFHYVTHFRHKGAMGMYEKGATGEQTGGQGRWGDKNKESSVMHQHYLRNLTPVGLMTAAGYDNNPRHFFCTRGNTLDMGDISRIKEDPDFSVLVEYMFPKVFCYEDTARRALSGYRFMEDYATIENDLKDIPQSLTNARFTQMLVALAVVFLQDAPLMLKELPGLLEESPYNNLKEEVLSASQLAAWRSIQKRQHDIETNSKKLDLERALENLEIVNEMKSHSAKQSEFVLGGVRTIVRDEMNSAKEEIISHGPKEPQGILAAAARCHETVNALTQNMQRAVGTGEVAVPNAIGFGVGVGLNVQEGQATRTEQLEIPYFLKKRKGLDIVGTVDEWEKEVIPRVKEDVMVKWYPLGDKVQKRRREKANLVFTQLSDLAKRREKNESVHDMALIFQQHVVEYDGIMEDVEGILRSAKKGVVVDVMDEKVIKEAVLKRTERNAARKRKREMDKEE